MSGPNGRYYSSVELSDDPTNFFSITPTPGSAHFCPAQAINPTFTQNLPGGGFLGLGAQSVAMNGKGKPPH